MSQWLDIALVTAAVLASAMYALYALGPTRIKNAYSRYATKYFGLRAARWFTHGASQSHNCNSCPAHREPQSK